MPLGAETIGTAYVRILTDGGGIDDDLRRQLKEHEGAFEAAGRRNSDAYADGLEEGMQGPSGRRMQAALQFAIAEGDLTQEFFEGKNWKDFEKSLKYRFGKAGEVAALEMEAGFKKKGNLVGVEQAILDITPRIVHATETIVTAEEKRARIEQAAADRRKKETDDFLAELDKIGVESERSLHKVTIAYNDATRASHDARDATREFGEEHEVFTEAERKVKNYYERHARGIGVLKKAEVQFDKLAEPMGRLFGRGSRNNFLNFFGSIITNTLRFGATVFKVFTRVISIVGKAISVFGDLFGLLVTNAKEGNRLFAGLGTSIATGLGGAIATAVANIPALIVGLVALAAGMALVGLMVGSLISGLLLLGGIITALAGSVLFALIGAVAALSTLLLPLAAVIGGIVGAVFALKDASGVLKDRMDALTESGKHLFEVFKSRLLRKAADDMKRLNVVLKDMGPLAKAVGRGMNRFIHQWVEALESPAFDHFIDKMTKFLPHAMKSLGTISSNVFTGLTGLFIALTPLANRFLNWLERITGEFSDWANSKKGRQEIREFLNKAADSAESLGGFLEETGGLLWDLLTAGQDTGDSILDDMADAIKRIRDYLKENPGALENFFADAKQTASDLGGLIEDIASAIDKIDSPQSRRSVKVMIEILGGMVIAAGNIISAFASVARAIVGAMRFATSVTLATVSAILGAIAAIPGPMGGAARAAQAPFETFRDRVMGSFDAIEAGLDGLDAQASRFNPAPKIDTGPMTTSISLLRNDWVSLAHLLNTPITPTINRPSSPATQGLDGPTNPRTTARANGRYFNIEQVTVVSPQSNPTAVAYEVINGLVGIGY